MMQWKNRYLGFDGPVYIDIPIMPPNLQKPVQITELSDKVNYQEGFQATACLQVEKCDTWKPLLISLTEQNSLIAHRIRILYLDIMVFFFLFFFFKVCNLIWQTASGLLPQK